MDQQRLGNYWENVKSSFWFVPSVCIVAAILLSILMPEVDRIFSRERRVNTEWIFGGDPSAARNLLAALATSLITVVSLAFSITMVVVQQAASQYSPHVIGNFIRSKGNQIVLGVYLGTFVYAMLILRTVRGDNSLTGEFIPAVAISFAMMMAMVCIALLVYFIHKTATSLQVSAITDRIHEAVLSAIEPLYPRHLGEPSQEADDSLETFRSRYPMSPSCIVTAEQSGYVRIVDVEALVKAVDAETLWTIVHPMVGAYVTRGEPIIEVGGTEELSEECVDRLRSVLILGPERSMEQDPLYGIRQLADVGLRALSPGMNDPSTARYALSHLGDVLAVLAGRTFPSRIRSLTNGSDQPDGRSRKVMLWVNSPRFTDFVEMAISPLRRSGKSDVQVTATLLNVLGAVNRCVTIEERSRILNSQIDQIVRYLDQEDFTEEEVVALRKLAYEARRTSQRLIPVTES